MLTKNITKSCFVLNIVIKEKDIFFPFDTSLVLCLLFKTHMVKTHTHGPALWTVPGSPHFYKVHGCGSFPSKIDGNLHSQLPERLARSRPVRGGIVFTKIPPSQQLCQERTVSQPTDIVPGNSFLLRPNEGCCHARVCFGHAATRGLFRGRSLSPSKIVSENAGPHGLCIPSATVGPASYAAPSALTETEGSIITDACKSRWAGHFTLCASSLRRGPGAEITLPH